MLVPRKENGAGRGGDRRSSVFLEGAGEDLWSHLKKNKNSLYHCVREGGILTRPAMRQPREDVVG